MGAVLDSLGQLLFAAVLIFLAFLIVLAAYLTVEWVASRARWLR